VFVEVGLLGSFTVTVDGVPTPASRWRRRHASALVKLLALSPGGRLHRDRVVDALWPELTLDFALPRLHKAAHYARRAIEDQTAVVLKDDLIALFPGARLAVDAVAFEAAADAALATDPVSQENCAAALKLAGDLLPDDLGEPWLDEPRERLRIRVIELARGARRWTDVLRAEPADEHAHVELLREAVVAGDRSGALRRYERMREVLEAELGVPPPPEAIALHERLLAADTVPTPRLPVDVDAVRTRDGPDLVEREAELQQVVTAVRAAVADARGGVVPISGEAGAGKSALVRAFRQTVRSELRVVMGGCDDLLAPPSLGPFRDMAAEDEQLASALANERLDATLPALLHVFAAHPLAVIVEDVHWADDATADAIRYLARRFPGIPGALVLTFRETGIDSAHPLRQLLGSLAGPTVRRVSLPPLTPAAIRRLGARSDAEAAEIHRVTRGNPFFVTEVLAAGGSGVPSTVQDAVLARLGRLPAPARTLLERLSVVPTRAERWLAETLADGDPEVLVDAERSGVVVGTEAWIGFRHELARQAIESSLTAGERLHANRTVVGALRARPGSDPSRLVHHAERSGQLDVIIEHGPAAAREADRLGAHRQAAEVLRVVLENPATLELREVVELTIRRAYALYLVNQFEAAFHCAQAAVEAAEQVAEPALQADALLVLARVVLFARGPMRARQAAARAVEILEPTEADARLALTESARAHSNLATVGIVADPSERAESDAARAVAIAQRIGREDIEAQARCYLGDARLARGDQRGDQDQQRAIAASGSDLRLETKVRSYVNAAQGAYHSGRLTTAEKYVAAGLRAAADFEFFAGRYRLRLTGAGVSASRGDWDRAIAELRALLDSPGEPGVMGPLAASLLARLLARRGDPQSDDVLAAALDHRAVGDDSFVAGPLAVAKVELGWLDGTLGELPDDAQRALDLAAVAGHGSMQAELCAYLHRAGIDVAAPVDPPGPWAPTLAGAWQAAATAWATLGERYERAVVLALADEPRARAHGEAMLRKLGAVATLAAI
jgi:DNA-binding SARP family transcriptional activator/tetratricopeptide (TPR) repeat protein